jgi:hypothetical protein
VGMHAILLLYQAVQNHNGRRLVFVSQHSCAALPTLCVQLPMRLWSGRWAPPDMRVFGVPDWLGLAPGSRGDGTELYGQPVGCAPLDTYMNCVFVAPCCPAAPSTSATWICPQQQQGQAVNASLFIHSVINCYIETLEGPSQPTCELRDPNQGQVVTGRPPEFVRSSSLH